MTDPQKPKWKKYEEFVASLHREFAPNAQIKHDDKILGVSGIERQIDVSVRTKISTFDLLIVMDCKDWKKPVDIQDVEQFAGAVEDVKANKGAMISNAGFSSTAKTKALQKGIDLYAAIDVQNVDWPVFLALPTLCDFRGLKQFSLSFRHSAPTPFAMPAINPTLIPIYKKSGQYIDIVRNLLTLAWNNGKLPNEPGEHQNVKFLNEEVFTKVGEVIYGPVEITSDLVVEQKLYFGHLPLVEARGFRDEIKGAFYTKSITTDKLDVVEVEKKWQRITKKEDLAIQPVMGLVAFDQYPLITNFNQKL